MNLGPCSRGGARVLLAAVCAVATALAAVAPGARAEAPRKIATVEGITEYRLDNGLRVLLFPDNGRPKVTVNMTVLVGSRQEGYGETGMAHLLEHMLFKGTPDHPDVPGAMKEHGAEFNGSTDVDRTNYYETLPAGDKNLEYAIGLEADRLVNSPIRAKDLATEFSVVRNEFEMGENSPESVLSQRMMAVAYEWHNYGKSVIGNRTDIERVPVDNLRAFYKRHYQPDNVVLIVAGAFEPAKALELISKYFGPIPRPERALKPTYTEEPAQDGERTVVLRRVGDVGLVGLLYHVPSGAHAEFAAVQVMAHVLASEPSGRLYKALVETKLASSVDAYPAAYHDPGVLEISAKSPTRDRAALERIKTAIVEVLEKLKKDGPTQEEVDRARQAVLKRYEQASQDPNRLAIVLSEWAAQGDWRLYFLNRDRVEKVTPEQVEDVARKYLRPSNRTVGFYVPTARPERTPVPERPDVARLVENYTGRAAESIAAESFDVDPLAIEKRVQRPEAIGGVKIALLPKKTRGGAVQVRIALHYGNAENLKGLDTAADFLPVLMTRGTRSMSRQQIKDALDKNFATLQAGAGGRGAVSAGGASFTVRTRRANLRPVLEIVRQILREPSLPASEFEILKNEEIAAIERARSEPMDLAMNHFQRVFYGDYPRDDVRYAPTIDESLERTRKAGLEQVRSIHRDYLGADHGEVAIVGDFEPSEVLPILEKTFENWKSSKPYARVERPVDLKLEPKRETVPAPDKANAIYLAGLQLAMKDDDPAYPAMLAGNYVLGGGSISSRIANRLRQKEGVSYGAQSMFSADALEPHAALMVFAIYNPINVEKVVRGVDEEIHRLLRDGVEPTELEKAKTGYLEQLKVQRTDDGLLAAQLVANLHVGRTMRHEAELEKAIRELTPDAVNAALRKHVDPKRLSIITAGDFTKKADK